MPAHQDDGVHLAQDAVGIGTGLGPAVLDQRHDRGAGDGAKVEVAQGASDRPGAGEEGVGLHVGTKEAFGQVFDVGGAGLFLAEHPVTLLPDRPQLAVDEVARDPDPSERPAAELHGGLELLRHHLVRSQPVELVDLEDVLGPDQDRKRRTEGAGELDGPLGRRRVRNGDDHGPGRTDADLHQNLPAGRIAAIRRVH